jgi:hypothetical protein
MKPSHTQTNLNSSKLFFCILLLGVAKSFSFGYSASFSTSAMEGLEMWYDGTDLNGDGTTDSGYSVGNAVNSWTDKSGNAYNMTVIGNPTWAKSGEKGVVNFDGNDGLYSTNYWGGADISPCSPLPATPTPPITNG